MTVVEIAEKLDLRAVQPDFDDRAVTEAYSSDLLSDVMANAGDADILITIQAHKNTVAVATLIGAAAMIICNNRPVPQDMVEAAARERIGIFVTSDNQFVTSGRLFQLIQG